MDTLNSYVILELSHYLSLRDIINISVTSKYFYYGVLEEIVGKYYFKLQYLNDHLVTKWLKYINWYKVPINQIIKYINQITDINILKYIDQHWALPEDIVRRYKDDLNLYTIHYHYLSEAFFEEFSDQIDWNRVFKEPFLSSQFITKYYQKSNWKTICQFQYLEPQLINKHYYLIDYQELFNNSELYQSEMVNVYINYLKCKLKRFNYFISN